MPDQDLSHSPQQCQKKMTRWPGAWRVASQRAISLMPRQPSQILIVQGRAWITWETGAAARPAPEQDVFLTAGQILDVPAGVRLVMESVDPCEPVDFDWRTMPAELAPRQQASVRVLLRLWLCAWLQLVQASAHLVRGLLVHGWHRLQGRKALGAAH